MVQDDFQLTQEGEFMDRKRAFQVDTNALYDIALDLRSNLQHPDDYAVMKELREEIMDTINVLNATISEMEVCNG